MSWGRHRCDPLDSLTTRQREVLRLLAEGLSNRGIAQELGVSEKAIVRHTSNIYDSLGLSDSVQEHRRVLAVRHFLRANATEAGR